MKVSLVQMNSINDKAANIASARALIERAVAEEAPDWVLLPEQFDWAGGARGDKYANAEVLPGGPAYAMAQELAQRHRIFIHAGSGSVKLEEAFGKEPWYFHVYTWDYLRGKQMAEFLSDVSPKPVTIAIANEDTLYGSDVSRYTEKYLTEFGFNLRSQLFGRSLSHCAINQNRKIRIVGHPAIT